MGKQIVKGGIVRLGGYDLTADVNAIALSQGVDALEVTSLADLAHNYIPGMLKSKGSVKGYWDLTTDGYLYTDLSTTDILSLALNSAEGSVGYFMRSVQAQYQTYGQVGKVNPMSLSFECAGLLLRGNILANKTAIAATGNGTGFQLGAVATGQNMYCALHVTRVSSGTPSLTGVLQSSVDNTFASPTTRLTFAAATGIGAQLLEVAGPITDQWWRFVWTESGSTPSFDFTVLAGSGPASTTF